MPADEGERYARGELIGLGGMSRVVLARDLRLGRDVALKEVGTDADPGLRARLAREATIAARLDHPGIVPVHDVGRRPDGTVYFAMRVVRGRSLAELARDGGPGVRERLLRAALAAAEAVGWAHAMGVVHRDLKPANIMVGEFGETQVVDWGLARTTDLADPTSLDVAAGDARDPALTRAGAVIGTPLYMAPEQARGEPADARSDVWSLGAILFDLVAGRPPHPGASSTDVLAAARRGVAPPLGRLAPDVPTDLAAIVDKALASRPDDRYPHAKALAEDLGRYLDGRRVAAHAYSTWDLVRRVARAWRAPLIVAAVALVAIVAAVVLAFVATEAGRVRAEEAERAARAALTRADHDLARALTDEALSRAADGARPEAEVLAARALVLAESPSARGVLASFAASPRPQRLSEAALPPGCEAPVLGGDGEVRCGDSVSRPLRWVGRRGDARWDAGYLTLRGAGGDAVTLIPCDPTGIGAVALDEPADRLAVVCRDGAVRLGRLSARALDRPGARAVAPGGGLHPPSTAAFVPGRDALVVGTTDGHVLVADLARGVSREASHDGGGVRAVDVSADGAVAAVLVERGGARLWRLADGAWGARLPARWAQQARFARDDAGVLYTLGPTLVRWRIREGAPTTWPMPDGVTSIAAAGDDVAVTRGGGVTLVDRASGRVRWSAPWPAGVVKAGDLVGPAFVAGSAGDVALRRWDRDSGRALPALEGGESARVRRLGALATTLGPVLLALPYEPRLVAFGPDGVTEVDRGASYLDLSLAADRRLAAVLRETPRALCQVSADPAPSLDHCLDAPGARMVALSPDGAIALAGGRRDVALFDLATGDLVGRLAVPDESDGELTDLAVSPDARWVAAGDRDGTTWVWRLRDGALVMRLRDAAERVASVAFDETGRLYSGGWDRQVRVRDLALLEAAPLDLARAVEDAWGLDLDAVVGRPGR